MLVSVHVPKCAGTSLRLALEQAYGRDRVHLDYDDRLGYPTSPINLDPVGFFRNAQESGYPFLAGKDAVHGHFHIHKYNSLKNAMRITFVREPISRMLSHYYYWKAAPADDHPLRNYVSEKNLTIFQFANLPYIKNFYTSHYFNKVDMKIFDFIGIHELYDDGIAFVSSISGIDIIPITSNTNVYPDYENQVAKILSDSSTVSALRDSLRDDVEFYERLCR